MIFNELLLIVCNVNLPIYLRLCHSHSDIFTAHLFFVLSPKQTVGFLIFSQYRPRSYMKNIGINYNDFNRKTVQYCAVVVFFFRVALCIAGFWNNKRTETTWSNWLFGTNFESYSCHMYVCVCIHVMWVYFCCNEFPAEISRFLLLKFMDLVYPMK